MQYVVQGVGGKEKKTFLLSFFYSACGPQPNLGFGPSSVAETRVLITQYT